MNGGEWLEEFATWLEGFAWVWFCTLTARPGLSETQIRFRLRRWTIELGDALGTPDFGWVGIPEKGVSGFHFHFHLLVAGLTSGCGAAERLCWMKKWYALAGDARITDFKPNCGGVRYIVKHVVPGDLDAIEIHLATRTPAPMNSSTKQNHCLAKVGQPPDVASRTATRKGAR
jgi:hypothetical protein